MGLKEEAFLLMDGEVPVFGGHFVAIDASLSKPRRCSMQEGTGVESASRERQANLGRFEQ